MVAPFISGWRKTGKAATSPKSPERIAPRHAAILVPPPADKMIADQSRLPDRIMAQCPGRV